MVIQKKIINDAINNNYKKRKIYLKTKNLMKTKMKKKKKI